MSLMRHQTRAFPVVILVMMEEGILESDTQPYHIGRVLS